MSGKFDEGFKEIVEQQEGIHSLYDYLVKTFNKYPEYKAITDKYSNIEMTYEQLHTDIDLFSNGLQSLGVGKKDFVGIFSENNGRWIVVDQAICKCGAIEVLRGSNAPVEELDYILGHSEAIGVILKDNKLYDALKPCLNKHNLKFIIIMFKKDDTENSCNDIPVYSYNDVIEMGKNYEFKPVEMELTDPCSMLYTSGTTGTPRGVLLTHKNFLSQLPGSHAGFLSQAGENTLQILPVWHAYEKIGQFYYFSRACHLHFTTVAEFKKDITRYEISSFMSVPRIWEAIRLGVYQKLKQKKPFLYYIFDFAVKTSITYKIHKMYSEKRITNKRGPYKILSRIYHKTIRSFIKPLHVLFSLTLYKAIKKAAGLAHIRASVSGGGALSMKDELFYDAIGVNIRSGYGLTETAPVLTLRILSEKNYLGSAGTPVDGTEVKIVDPTTHEELSPFQKGLIMARGPQVMLGYYKDEAATKAVLSEDGWFNTGDLGWLTGNNFLVIVGRLKETIVLSSGENVEPVPIEEAILGSPYIEQVVLVGQDQGSVGALVVPSKAALEKCGILAKELKSGTNLEIKNPNLRELMKKEIAEYIKNKTGLKPFEKVKQFKILKDSFNLENGMLTQSAKVKRNTVFERYKELISKMFDSKSN